MGFIKTFCILVSMFYFTSCKMESGVNDPQEYVEEPHEKLAPFQYQFDFGDVALVSSGGSSYTFQCYYDTNINDSVSLSTPCTNLDGLVFDEQAGSINWVPDSSQLGDYEFLMIAENSENYFEDLFSYTVTTAGQPFTFVWNSNGQPLRLPLVDGFNYNFTVDWGNGSSSEVTSANDPDAIYNAYVAVGPHTVTITGLVEAWDSSRLTPAQRLNFLEVTNLGNVGWRSLKDAFADMSNLTTFNGGVTSSVTDMSRMFRDSPQVVPDTSSWDTSQVTDMREMFVASSSANPDVTNWNVSKVESMNRMFGFAVSATPNTSNWETSSLKSANGTFRGAILANPEVTNWNVSQVTDMAEMFREASNAAPNTASWNTGNVTNMAGMFFETALADPNVINWDVSKVTDFSNMFGEASLAEPDVSNWITSSALYMNGMFEGATSANPDVSNWNMSNVLTMEAMFENANVADPSFSCSTNFALLGQSNPNQQNIFKGSSISSENYANFLITLKNTVGATNVLLSNPGITYTANAAPERNFLESTYNWSITDGGSVPGTSSCSAAGNSAPSISNVPNQTTSINTPKTFTFTIGDIEDTLDCSSAVVASGFDSSKIQSIVISGTEPNCSATITPISAATGLTTVTFTVTDSGSLTDVDTFEFNITDADFISVWRTTSANESITLPLRAGFNYDFSVDWGDGTSSLVTSHDDTDITHFYATAGDYTVTISGLVEAWHFNGSGDKDKFIKIIDLGNVGWKNLENAFSSCVNLTTVSGGNLNLVTTMRRAFFNTDNLTSVNGENWGFSALTTMEAMFSQAQSLVTVIASDWNTENVDNMKEVFFNNSSLENLDTSLWDTSSVLTMSSMFENAVVLLPDVLNWDVGSVVDMTEMFSAVDTVGLNVSNWDTSAAKFMGGMFIGVKLHSSDFTGWDTTSVVDMHQMFAGSIGNPDLSNFITSEVLNMSEMFEGSLSVTVNVGNWNTSKVTDMREMFNGALNLDPDVGSWNTSNVEYMEGMFKNADSANPDVSSWNTSKVKRMTEMFQGAITANPDLSSWSFAGLIASGAPLGNIFQGAFSLSNTNYDNFLIRADATSTLNNLNIGDIPAAYTPTAATARANLINDGWIINDEGPE